MRENRLRTLWQQNKHAINGWLAIPNSFSAEVMAHQGWDTLTVDMQHGVIDYAQMVTMLQAISTTPTVPIVRVPWLEPGIIMKSLDAGAYGVICPMVNTREDAQKIEFDDHLIYEEVATPISQRKIPMKQLLRTEALAAFKEWGNKSDRIRY